MTTQNTFPINDLVLRVSGGHRDGEFVPVTTQKCLLGLEPAPGELNKPLHCAIFRGSQGTVVRSYADEITVNGTATTVHWLVEGDRIELPNHLSLEVTQLGQIDQPADDLSSAAELESLCDETTQGFDGLPSTNPESANPESTNPESARTESARTESVRTESVRTESVRTESDRRLDRRLESVEFQIREIQEQSELTRTNLETLNQRLDHLCQQISRMVSATNNGGIGIEESSSFIQQTTTAQAESEEFFMNHNEHGDGTEAKPDSETTFTLFGDQKPAEFYSDAEDSSHNERIVPFDPEAMESSDSVESVQPSDVIDASVELKGISHSEIDERLAEMERVFGGSLSDTDAESSAESIHRPSSEDPSATLSRESLPTQSLDAPSTEPLMPNPANDSPGHPFEDLTHSQNEDAESFAVNPTLEPEEVFVTDPLSQQIDEALIEPGSLASQLLQEVESGTESVQEETPEETPEIQSTEAPVIEAPNKESVADLLARMKSEGQWSGIPGDDDVAPPPTPVMAEPQPAHEPTVNEGGSEDDVQDYMSQLLTRMRGGAPAAEKKPVPQPKQPEPVIKTEEIVVAPPTNPLKPEEFLPKRKATKIESFDAMRELANSSARSAVRQSQELQRKTLAFLQGGIAVASFVLSVYYLVMSSQQIFDMPFIIGLICLSLSGFLGLRCYLTTKYDEPPKLMDLIRKMKKPQSKAKQAPTKKPVADANPQP